MSHASGSRIVIALLRLTFAIAVFSVMSSSSSVFASCGDYLLGGHHANTNAAHRDDGSNVAAGLHDNSLPAQPYRSSCENGRCHAAPPLPVSDPQRVSLPKRIDFVEMTMFAPSFPGRTSWMASIDARLPASPYLEVVSPPPKAA